jgi:D-threo-aldose 1-dehydrogenase
MELNNLGRGGLKVTRHSFGAAGIGNLYRTLDEEVALDAVQEAWDQGVRYFDSAPHYGLGLSEKRIGKVLSNLPRSEFTFSTKVGRLLVDNPSYQSGQLDDQGFAVPATTIRKLDYSRDAVFRSVEESLERTGLGYIDLVFVHDPDDHYKEALEGAFVALEELRGQGVIKSYGAGMNQSEMLANFVRETNLDVVMLAGRFTLFEQTALEDLLPLTAKRGVSVVAAGVFNSGLLSTNRPKPGANYNYEPASNEVLERANLIADVCESHGHTLPEAAAQFPLLHKSVATICLGASSAEQVKRNASLFEKQINQDLWKELSELGFISEELLLG